jgi:hypothetical protein
MLLRVANVVLNLPILVTLMKEALISSEFWQSKEFTLDNFFQTGRETIAASYKMGNLGTLPRPRCRE